jgi:hypothetical protein
MSAKTIPFQIQVGYAGRRYRGEGSLEFWHRRGESRGRRRGGHVERTAMPRDHDSEVEKSVGMTKMANIARPLLSIRIRPIGEVR